MPSASPRPEKRAEIEDLARAIREAVDAELGELAANLATTDDAHLFGQNEFKSRAVARKIAAKALEQQLARKKAPIRNRARKAAPTCVTSALVYPSDESQCRAPRGDRHDALHLARGYRLRLVGARRRRTPVPELRTDDARL